MAKRETRDEAIARAERESIRATLYAWAFEDQARKVKPAATEKITLYECGLSRCDKEPMIEKWTIDLYRPTSPSGGYIVITRTDCHDATLGDLTIEVYLLDPYVIAARENASALGRYHYTIRDAIERLHSIRNGAFLGGRHV